MLQRALTSEKFATRTTPVLQFFMPLGTNILLTCPFLCCEAGQFTSWVFLVLTVYLTLDLMNQSDCTVVN